MFKRILTTITLSTFFVFTGCSSKGDVSTKDMQPKQDSSNFSTISQDGMQGGNGFGQNSSGIQSIYFDYDQFIIKPEQAQVVKTNAAIIKADRNNVPSVQLQGNCDDRGTQEYNIALGLKRANAVKTEIEKYGINVSKITVVSFGKDNPVCQTNDEECWAKNRRVDFALGK